MTRRALIIGGGIAGPVVAMALQRVGIGSVVAEARSALSETEGAFLGVAPNGMNALKQLGITLEGEPCHAFEFRNSRDEIIGDIDRRRDVHDFSSALTMIRRSDLHVALTREAQRRGIEIHYGTELKALEETRATFKNGQRLEGDVVIGCDGARSKTRQLIFPDAPPPERSGLIDFGGFAPLGDAPLEVGVNVMLFGKRAFFGAFRTSRDEVWWFHNGPPGSDLLSLHRDDVPWVRKLIESTPNILGPWPLQEVKRLRKWSAGKVCLLGDAAHAMSPSAGQGASLAFEDALVIARCLVERPETAFADFERERRPRTDAIAKEAARQSSNKAPSALGAWFRDRMLKTFLRYGAAAQSKAYAYVSPEPRLR